MKNLKMNLKPLLLSALFLLGSSASAQNRAAQPAVIVNSMLKSLALDQKAKAPANPALNAAIIAALPSIKGPAASVAMRLLKTDLSKSESQRFLAPLEKRLTSNPKSDFNSLSPEKQSLALSEALVDAARVANEGAEGFVFLAGARGGLANSDLKMDTAEEAEGVLLDSHPYLDEKNKQLLGKAYPELQKQSKAYQDRVTFYAGQIAARLVGERGLEDEVVIPVSETDDRDNREDDDRARSETSESDREYRQALENEQHAQARQQRDHALRAERRFTEMSESAVMLLRKADAVTTDKMTSPNEVAVRWATDSLENLLQTDAAAHEVDVPAHLEMGQHPTENKIFQQIIYLLHRYMNFVANSPRFSEKEKEKHIAATMYFEMKVRNNYGE